MPRARDFQTQLTKLFGDRVSLAEIDLRNQPGKVEYGLRVTAGPVEGLKKPTAFNFVLRRYSHAAPWN